MKSTVYGYSHLTGVSTKTGKPYDFYKLCVLVPDNWGVGMMAVDKCFLTPAEFDKYIQGKTMPFDIDITKDLSNHYIFK